jgi:KDO2-lipid IV(A) lauroyltransferase
VKGEADGAYPCSEVDAELCRPRSRRKGRQQQRIDVDAIAFGRLEQPELAVEQGIFRDGPAHRRGAYTRFPMASAVNEAPRPHERALLRRLAYLGARYGPSLWVRGSPPWFGALFALALPDMRRRVRENLRWVQGRRPRVLETRDVLRTFTDYAACLAESLAADREEARHARVTVDGAEHLRRALEAGRGAVLVTAHAGPWDVVARYFAAEFGAEVAMVMEAEPDVSARALHDAVRRRSGAIVLRIGESPLDGLSVLRHVRNGGVAAFQIDRPARSGRSVPASLFGRPFEVPEGPFRLAELARAPVIPLFAAREGYFRYRVVVAPPIVPRSGAPSETRPEAVEAAIRALERFVRSYPTQWFHFGER